MRLSSPRVPPLPVPEYQAVHRAAFGADDPRDPVLTIRRYWAHHPGLTARGPIETFASRLFAGVTVLPDAERELVILRMGWLCAAVYEFGQHTLLAREAGLTDEDVHRVTRGPDAEGWSPAQATLLRAVDELHADHIISDRTWRELSARYDLPAILDIIVVAGKYWTTCVTLNSLGVQQAADTPGFPAGAEPSHG